MFGRGDPTFSKDTLKMDQDWAAFACEARLIDGSGYAPARLRMDAFDKQYAKFTKAMHPLPQECRDAFDLLRSLLQRGISPCRVLPEDCGILGIKDEEGELQPIDLSTSAGYLFSKRGKKREWVTTYRSLWDQYCKLDWDNLRGGNPLYWIWRLSLKDEKMPVERIVPGVDQKTRVFCAAPFPILMSGRRLTGDFARKFYKLSQMRGFLTTVGINVFGGGWHKMIQDITNDFAFLQGYEGDIKGQDKNMFVEILYLVLDLITSFYPEEDRDMISAHWERIVHKLVVDLRGTIVLLELGNPSGGNDTVIINTLVAMAIVILAWMRLVPGMDLGMFLGASHDSIYGDDVLGFSSVMTYERMQDAVESFGFQFAGRNGTLFDLQFLGRTTIIVDGFALPVLASNRVLGIMEWVRNEDEDSKFSRMIAAYTQAFPLLFTEKWYVFWVIRKYVQRVCKQMELSLNPNLRKAALSVPSPFELGEFYCGQYNALKEIVAKRLIECTRAVGDRK